MKAIEFEATLDSDGKIVVPEAFEGTLAKKTVKVILLYEGQDRLTPPANTHFTKGYDQKDTRYGTY